MSTLLFFVFGIFVGLSVRPKLSIWFALEYRHQVKAICKRFGCEKNSFTYFLEDSDGYYILSLDDREYRIKFSISKPSKIVYCQEVERI